MKHNPRRESGSRPQSKTDACHLFFLTIFKSSDQKSKFKIIRKTRPDASPAASFFRSKRLFFETSEKISKSSDSAPRAAVSARSAAGRVDPKYCFDVDGEVGVGKRRKGKFFVMLDAYSKKATTSNLPSSLNFLSSDFDAAAALQTTSLLLPVPNIRTMDNVAQCKLLLPDVTAKPQRSERSAESAFHFIFTSRASSTGI